MIKKNAFATGVVGLVVSALLLAPTASGQANNIRLVASAGVKSAMDTMLPDAERSIGKKVSPEFGASKTLTEQLGGGEQFDAAILTRENIDALIQRGKIEPKSLMGVARTGVAIGFRAGAPKPDITSSAGLKRTLLKAKSITLNPNGASTAYFDRALDRLGITEQIKPKLLLETDLEKLRTNVVNGKSELVVALASEVKASKGVALAGPLPGDLQGYVIFAAGISTSSHSPDAAMALLKFVTSPAGGQVLKAKGLEPL